MADDALEVGEFIEARPLSAFQIFVFVLCTLIVLLDGFDAQAIGYVVPELSGMLGIEPGAMWPILSAGLVGLMLGALLIAPLADRFGRRPVLLVSVGLVGVFSLATAWASDFDTLLILRFLTGLGLGGSMPNAIALTSEYAPARRRSLVVMAMFGGFTLGSIVGGLLSAQLVPEHGWRIVFVIGGVAPLALLAFLLLTLPESIRFLGLAETNRARIAALVRKIDPAAPVTDATRIYARPPEAARMSVVHLFKDGRALTTLLLWVIFFMSLLDIYLLVNWLRTAMSETGAPQRVAILIGTILQVGGLVAVVPLAWAMDRRGPRATMAAAYLAAAVAIAGIGVFAGVSVWATVVAVFLAGFGVIGGQTAANALAAVSYPTEIRSTGVGWALGVGRVGSIVGPAVAGVLLTLDVSIRDIFLLSAVPALLAALAALLLRAPSSKRPQTSPSAAPP
jgi:AAHS family 4-hydroxybenzoate transporter-like MFS transporter